MDLEQLPTTKTGRTIFSTEVEALLEKERLARQDSNHPLSATLLVQIVCH